MARQRLAGPNAARGEPTPAPAWRITHTTTTHQTTKPTPTTAPDDADLPLNPTPTHPTPLDLRRHDARSLADLISSRADFLSTPDARLLLAIYRDGVHLSTLAAVSGLPPSTLRNRVRRLVRHLTDPRFDFVLARQHTLTPTTRRVARACFLKGRPIREAARELALTVHTVRRHRDAVLAMYNATRSAAWRTVPRGLSAAALRAEVVGNISDLTDEAAR